MNENTGYLEEKLFVIYRYVTEIDDTGNRIKKYLGNSKYKWHNKVNEVGVEMYENHDTAFQIAKSWSNNFVTFYVEEI